MLAPDGTLKVLPLKIFEVLYRPKRYKVFFGGRGSAKSWGVAEALVTLGVSRRMRILCARELQKSIQDSVHRLLVDTITRLGLDEVYEHTKVGIFGTNGTEFIFSGIASNITGIKSMEGIDILWVEEAENVSEYSWTVLIPTFRKTGSEIWLSFNPFDELDATYTRFVTPYLETLDLCGVYEDDRIYVRKVNYAENPYFAGTELQEEMETDKTRNYNKYLHIWMGECNADYEDSIIKPEWIRASIDAHIKLGLEPLGIKTVGFDPADEGSDAKALAFVHGPLVLECKTKDDGDISDGIDWAFTYADEQRATHLVYDGIGIGAAVKERLRRSDPSRRTQYESFIASHLPHDPEDLYENDRPNKDVFRNQRAQYWWYLRDKFYATYQAVEKGIYTEPSKLISLSSEIKNLTALRSELVRVQRKRGRDMQQIQVESKVDMRARGMPSPNLADALVMAYAVKQIRMAGDNPLEDWTKPINT